MMQSWSVVVFCYNEVATVGDVLRRVCSIFDEARPGLYEVIVVDDGSTDGSYEKILEAARVRPEIIRVVRHPKNLGIGRTLRDGYEAARNENVTAVPADGQFDVRELLPHLDVEEGSFISFYRLENVQYSSFRNALSTANRYINRIFNGIALKDVNWVKVYKRSAIISFSWELQSSLIESEICAKLLLSGQRAIEVLSYYHPRQAGRSKGASLPVLIQALRETPKLMGAVRRFRKTLAKNV